MCTICESNIKHNVAIFLFSHLFIIFTKIWVCVNFIKLYSSLCNQEFSPVELWYIQFLILEVLKITRNPKFLWDKYNRLRGHIHFTHSRYAL